MTNNGPIVTSLDSARSDLAKVETEQRRAKIKGDNGGEPPMDTLEQRVTRIEERMATKDDVRGLEVDIAKLETRLAWRFVALYGSMTATMAGLLALFKFIH